MRRFINPKHLAPGHKHLQPGFHSVPTYASLDQSPGFVNHIICCDQLPAILFCKLKQFDTLSIKGIRSIQKGVKAAGVHKYQLHRILSAHRASCDLRSSVLIGENLPAASASGGRLPALLREWETASRIRSDMLREVRKPSFLMASYCHFSICICVFIITS
jgi:hypothetical protein